MTDNPYGPRFWAAYLSNTGLMVAVSMLFRYADFVNFLGGSEKQLGFITGLGMLGAITARCLQGFAIDRYGASRVWLLSLFLLVTCLVAHLAVGSLQPPLIHVLRLFYTVSLAGAFGASITYVSLRAPTNRMGEMIGMLGSSGFIGMAIGPMIGDRIFAGADLAGMVTKLFLWAAGAGFFSAACAWMATAGDSRRSIDDLAHPHAANPLQAIWVRVREYHPGWTLLVGFAMGVGIGMPGTFLSTFASEKGFAGLGWFFLPYAIIAFIVRIFTRKLSDRWGTRPTILVGLTCLGLSMLAYMFVTVEQTLVFPASLAGFAHAFLFPATVAEASHSFPIEFRGLATNLILTMFDIGMLLGQPAFGWTVDFSRQQGWNGYFVAFSALAAFQLAVAVVYAASKLSSVAPVPRAVSDMP